MADGNETLEQVASDESTEQPTEPQTVESDSAVEESTESAEEAPSELKPETTAPRLYAGKYKTVEELEEGYRHSNAEAARMAQEINRSTKPKPETAEQKYSIDQLESWKEGRLVELADARSEARRAYAEGRIQEAQQLEAQSKESARQIRLIDKELMKLGIQSTLGETQKREAEGRLTNDAVSVLKQYKDELVPGTQFHSKASEIMNSYIAMGMDPDNALVQAQAVSMAAQILGMGSKTVEAKTRKELTKTISTALKQGVVSGAGKATKGSTAIDFLKMSDKEFAAYKRQHNLA